MAVSRKNTVTRTQANKVLASIKKRYAADVTGLGELDQPKLIENWDWNTDPAPWAIVWESGPYEWAVHATYGGYDEEFRAEYQAEFGEEAARAASRKGRFVVAELERPAGVMFEAETKWALGLYPATPAEPAARETTQALPTPAPVTAEQDMRDRWRPSPDAVRQAKALLDAESVADLAAVPIYHPGKQEGLWEIGQEVCTVPGVVLLGVNSFDPAVDSPVPSYSWARNAASGLAKAALGDRPGTCGWATIRRDGTWAVFED